MKGGRKHIAQRKRLDAGRKRVHFDEPEIVAKAEEIKISPFVIEARGDSQISVYGSSYTGLRQGFSIKTNETWMEEESIRGSFD